MAANPDLTWPNSDHSHTLPCTRSMETIKRGGGATAACFRLRKALHQGLVWDKEGWFWVVHHASYYKVQEWGHQKWADITHSYLHNFIWLSTILFSSDSVSFFNSPVVLVMSAASNLGSYYYNYYAATVDHFLEGNSGSWVCSGVLVRQNQL